MFRDGEDFTAAGEVFKDLSHFAFQMKSGIDDCVGLLHQLDVAGRGFEEVGIDLIAH